MTTLFIGVCLLATIFFLGGVYIGTRWSEKIKAVYFSIVSR